MANDVLLNPCLILALAISIDAISGEPEWLYKRVPHPVVLMAKFLMTGEAWLNIPKWPSALRRFNGFLLVASAIAFMIALGLGLEHLLSGNIGGDIIITLILSSLLAGRSLYDHVHKVRQSLIESNGLDGPRAAVGMIIGRQTETLDEAAISRASIESLAENYSDGFIAPAFWFLIGGLPGILVYKMVNTADSMIGHRSERYLDFGWAAARIDDAMNLIPARLTAYLFALSALSIKALKTAFTDAKKHASPNAGWPEAAMAGALGLRLGGPRQYPGNVIVEGVWLGSGTSDATPDHISRGLKIASVSHIFILICTLIPFLIQELTR